jgi:hypothetical protein
MDIKDFHHKPKDSLVDHQKCFYGLNEGQRLVSQFRSNKLKALTFDADNMVPDLLSQDWIWYGFDEVIDGINGRVDTLKALNLLSYGH